MSEQKFATEDIVMALMFEAMDMNMEFLIDGLETGEVDIVYEVKFEILGEEE